MRPPRPAPVDRQSVKIAPMTVRGDALLTNWANNRRLEDFLLTPVAAPPAPPLPAWLEDATEREPPLRERLTAEDESLDHLESVWGPGADDAWADLAGGS